MREMRVKGGLEAVGWQEGSSGRFTGDIAGLYTGWRDGNPPVQPGFLPLANGGLALELRHQWQVPMPPRPPEHPFAGGRTIDDLARERRPLGGPPGAGGPPPGVGGPPRAGGPPQGGPPPGMGGPPPGMGGPPPGMGGPPGDREVAFRDKYKTKVTLRIDPARSTGIYAGATGELTLEAPAHREAGHLVVNTAQGDLTLSFLEWPEGGKLVAELTVDGSRSTGAYRNAQGTLRFELDRIALGVGKGTYSGVLQLEADPARA